MSPDPHRYLVTGATGHLGGLVAASLLRHARRIRLLARGPAGPGAGNARDVQLVHGRQH